jgi:YfiH family protein
MTKPWIEPEADPAGTTGPPLPDRLRVLTTVRWGGVSVGPYAGLNLALHVGDDPTAVAENRRRLQADTRCERIQWLNQVHGTVCIRSTAENWQSVPDADAAWTTESGLGLAILTADCVPLVLCDRRASVLAVAHGGWRGLVSGVIEQLVAQLPVPPDDLLAWLGPAIGPDAYEIGPEVAAAVIDRVGSETGEWPVLRRGVSADRWQLDLFALSSRLLGDCGITSVHSQRLCTASDARFFSYRRDGVTGRMATLAWLAG